MKDKEKKNIEKALFQEANNKEEIINNCNNILDAHVPIEAKVEYGYKHTQRRFAIISVACLLVIVVIAMIVFVPPMFKPDSGAEDDGIYFFSQSELRSEIVNDIDTFIKENQLSFKILELSNNVANTSWAYYNKDAFVGLEQELFVVTEEFSDVGSVFIYPSNYYIDKYDEINYDKVDVDGITVEFLAHTIAGEYEICFLFTYQCYKYYFEISSEESINFEYYVKQIAE